MNNCSLFCLCGNNALVTGAAGGIGTATANNLAKQGANLVLVDIREEELNKVANDIRSKYNNKIETILCDLSKGNEVKNLFNKALEKVEKIDILVNNAGLFKKDDWNTGTDESYFSLAMKINFESQFILCQEASKHMATNKYGRIVNVASIGAYCGGIKYASYCASKSAILGLTKSLALEYAKSGVTLNAVAPGIIDTPMVNILSAEEKDYFKNTIPLGRLGKPQDIANAITFLCTKESEYITGSIVHVNGGMVMY